ncbi:MAG: methyltransferase domain-containing protein [Acidobacteriaceae bacterium]|nr:methyltransferase domain-containing protein [Acidobacteriaceae bacterium]
MFRTRVLEPEMLDHLPAEEARPNLADLVRINRLFGGHAVIRKSLARVATPGDRFTVLDIGAASGDTAELIRTLYPRATVISLDYTAVNLERAPFPKVLANAFELPLRAGSVDYVMSSLFLHHFTDAQVVALLRSFQKTARRAVIMCDLERHAIPYWFLRFTKPILGWNDITVHDGLISVRAAFRAPELLQLARQAGMADAEIESFRPAFRIALVARKA